MPEVKNIDQLMPYIWGLIAVCFIIAGSMAKMIYDNYAARKKLVLTEDTAKSKVKVTEANTEIRFKEYVQEALIEDSARYRNFITSSLQETKQELKDALLRLDKNEEELEKAVLERYDLEARIQSLEELKQQFGVLQEAYHALKNAYEELVKINEELSKTRELQIQERDLLLYQKDFKIRELEDKIQELQEEINRLNKEIEEIKNGDSNRT